MTTNYLKGCTMVTLQDIARAAAGYFTTSARPDGSGTYVHTHGSPEWVQDLVRDAHTGGMLPDDTRYLFIWSALDAIADGASDDDDHGYSDPDSAMPYMDDRAAWLGSHGHRPMFCDDYADEFGHDGPVSVFDLIGRGVYMERREVFASVLSSLTARLEEIGEQS